MNHADKKRRNNSAGTTGKTASQPGRFAQGMLIFSMGFFALSAQALLFREFLVSFEGNELGIGAFFGSWFFWIGIGAALVLRSGRLADTLAGRIEGLVLLYLPAFVVQHYLIGHARTLIGIDPYQLFSLSSMLAAALLVNGPVSMLTGMLFPLACHWVSSSDTRLRAGSSERESNTDAGQGVSWVYLLEAAGSFLGGLTVTSLLAKGFVGSEIFLGLAILVALSVAVVSQRHKHFWPAPALLALLLVVTAACGGAAVWKNHLDRGKWTRLLKDAEFSGSFHTAQAEYLYGHYEGQFLVSSYGQVSEMLPNTTHGAQLTALSMAQNPRARRILVAGPGSLALCQQLLRLRQVEELTIYHPDPQYIGAIEAVLADNELLRDWRLRFAGQDIRQLLKRTKGRYDLVLLNFPDPTTAVLNRYRTVEFYQIVKAALAPGGVAGARVSGGENVIGSELANLGASCLRTLEEVFERVVIKGGEETWFFAGNGAELTEQPGALRDRWAQMPQAEAIFPAEGLFSIYLPDRITFARQMYAASPLPNKLLINRDGRPLAHLYSLMLLGKHSKSPLVSFVKQVSLTGVVFFLLPIAVVLLLRSVYVARSRGARKDGTWAGKFLIFSMGLASIGIEIVLMYLYQSRYGSLYLYVGLIAALLMLGLTVGAGVSRWLLSMEFVSWQRLAITAATIQAGLLMVATRLEGHWNYPLFLWAFVLCGLLTGVYFPAAAQALRESGVSAQRAGGKLELLDHFGAAAGGFLTGVTLIAILGTSGAFWVLAAVVVVNIPLILLERYRRAEPGDRGEPRWRLRKAGYVCFGVGLSVVASSHMLAQAAGRMTTLLSREKAAFLAPTLTLQSRQARIEGAGGTLNYFEVTGGLAEQDGYIYSSEVLAGEVRGYAGPIYLAVRVDAEGNLVGFGIIESNETPAYLDMLSRWRKSLAGQNLFTPGALANVAAVSGATLSCEAIVAILERSGARFAGEVLGVKAEGGGVYPASRVGKWVDAEGMYILLASLGAILLSRYGSRWRRRIFLLGSVVIGGWYFNVQYSSEQVISLLSGHYPSASLTHNFVLVLGVPLLTILVGNLYCGYLCPFGALQELLHFLTPARGRMTPGRWAMQWARFGKYVVLLVLVGLFFIGWDRDVLKVDVLINIFSMVWREYNWVILWSILAGSVLFTRFWCRYLCPAGAFLSLLGAWAPLKRILPSKYFGRCDLGVSTVEELDCIRCDRCRYEQVGTTVSEESLARGPSGIFVNGFLISLVSLLLVVGVVVSARPLLRKVEGVGQLVQRSSAAAGRVRNVDVDRLRRLIEEDRLSDYEALFYRQIEPADQQRLTEGKRDSNDAL